MKMSFANNQVAYKSQSIGTSATAKKQAGYEQANASEAFVRSIGKAASSEGADVIAFTKAPAGLPARAWTTEGELSCLQRTARAINHFRHSLTAVFVDLASRSALQEISRLDDHLLNDIGLSRIDVVRAEVAELGSDRMSILTSARAIRTL
jgi:hypothetical protein